MKAVHEFLLVENFEEWERELKRLSQKVQAWFCWKRKEKWERLKELCQVGSQYLEHTKLVDPDKVKRALRPAEIVVLSQRRYLSRTQRKRT